MTEDERFMAAALALGRRGLGRSAPNPSVGALVVKDGIVVGRGWTGDGGRPHGETIALAEAGAAAKGATIYVTLEPCSHHGRTPPCCEAIVTAGIVRLVYAVDDPNPLVAGKGAGFCRERGLEVTGGVGAEQAARDHRGHMLRMIRQRPLVTLKLAETANGYVAGGPHDPRLAITGVTANALVHGMRAIHDAIMVGIGTVRADDPLMTVRLPGVDARPLRIVLDSRLQIRPHSRLLQTARDTPVLVLTCADAYDERQASLAAIEGLEIVVVQTMPDGRLDMIDALRTLAARGVTRIFSEGGPTVASTLIRGGLVDDILIFTAPRPLAGEGVPTLDALSRAALAHPAEFRFAEERQIGVDRLRRYESVG